ncbi:MAG TPA: PfkB family carbohydrate kinase [Thermodesulfobacteriota bacterium]|nr:PfkB family carbohydrate kinase [Thermodesulfobacteriota bacterium]
MKRFDVVGIGQVCIDYVGKVERYPEAEGRVELEEPITLSGGPTATALTVLARYGLRVAFVGKVGDDDTGRKVTQDLEEEGVDTSFLIVEKNRKTQFSFIPVERQSGRRTVFWSRGSVTPLKPKEIKKGIITHSRAIHFDDLYTEAVAEAARIAKRSNVIVSMDAGNYEEGMGELKGKVDLFIVSLDFLKQYSGEANPRKGIKKLKDFRATVTTVTLGDKGSLTIYDNRLIEIPAYRVEAVDTTGAGDVFHGAFLYGWLQNWEVEHALKFASAAAAVNCLKLGARGGISKNPDEVFDFMRKKDGQKDLT